MLIEGKIVNHDSAQYGQIKINPETGLIDEVGENLGVADLKTENLIFPGFVDVHVHCREDASGKEMYKEDYQTASRAALHGGVVHVADMPNNPVPPFDEESYKAKAELAKKSQVDVTLYAAIGENTKPLSFRAPYKVFLSQSPVGELANYSAQFASFHCEDSEILKANEGKPTHAARRPRQAEIAGITFAIDMIKKFNLRGKICHLSTKEGLGLVVEAKKAGVDITCEITPHHLYFDETAKWQMNPPLRTREDCIALAAGLQDGDADFLATDHAPHTWEEQQAGVSGLPHLDTYGAFVTWLMKEQGFTPQEIARVCAYNPGNFVNNFSKDKFGRIQEGYVGSLTIINPEAPTKIEKAGLQTKVKWSPFEGVVFPGRVTYTIIRGKIYKI